MSQEWRRIRERFEQAPQDPLTAEYSPVGFPSDREHLPKRLRWHMLSEDAHWCMCGGSPITQGQFRDVARDAARVLGCIAGLTGWLDALRANGIRYEPCEDFVPHV